MHNALSIARQKLQDGGYTCVILLKEKEFNSHERGVRPLLTFLESGNTFQGGIAADKTVGAGAAHLYVLLGVQAVWANVISRSAKDILEQNGIEVLYGECVPYIINRQGNGICPIEKAVENAQNSLDALTRIKEALQHLQQNNANT